VNFESDHLVLQYLGEVGDAAQRRLRPADRARMVERLRSRINSERERLNAHTAASVQAILDRLGTPDTVVGHELYRLGDLRDSGADDAVGAMSMRGSRNATVARQMGFKADATPIPAIVDPSRPQPAAPAPAPAPPPVRVPAESGPPTLAETAAGAGPVATSEAPTAVPLSDPEEEPLWWRSPPGGGPPERPEPGTYGDGSLHAPAYPIGVVSDASATWEDDPLTEPTPAIGLFGGPGALRTQVREVFAIALIVIGAIVASTVVVVLGYLVVFTAGAWTLKERKISAFYVPGATAVAFAIGMWMRATGHLGADLTRDQAWDRYGELLPAMVRVAAVAGSLYLLWRLNKRAITAG